LRTKEISLFGSVKYKFETIQQQLQNGFISVFPEVNARMGCTSLL